MHYGPAHVVWDDENFNRGCIQRCVDDFNDWITTYNDPKDDDDKYSAEELEAVRQSLIELLALPDAVLEPIPEAYDDEHPDKFPPALEMAFPKI